MNDLLSSIFKFFIPAIVADSAAFKQDVHVASPQDFKNVVEVSSLSSQDFLLTLLFYPLSGFMFTRRHKCSDAYLNFCRFDHISKRSCKISKSPAKRISTYHQQKQGR